MIHSFSFDNHSSFAILKTLNFNTFTSYRLITNIALFGQKKLKMIKNMDMAYNTLLSLA